jgi:hypothetical protein
LSVHAMNLSGAIQSRESHWSVTKVPIEVSECGGTAGSWYEKQIAVEPGRVVTCHFVVCDNM